jgi:ABC-type lipoprotein export system ATPase subunit
VSGNRSVIRRTTTVERTPRVMQMEGMFDVPPSERSDFSIAADLPLDDQPWQIGLIVGPSGSGKSTVLSENFGIPQRNEWPATKSVADGFPARMALSEITGALSSVGFSSPPSWMRPYSTLSNGEQFRADLARTLIEAPDLAVVDEFTSVVDRTVAKIASASVAKHVRRGSKKLVVASCHYDVIDWLTPDWVFDTSDGTFRWECLQRPSIEVEVYRTTTEAWSTFHRYHYLTADINRSAQCFVGLIEGHPAVFSSYLNFPHPRIPHAKRMHRTVCLPDFQGVGLGTRMQDLVASFAKASGARVFTSHSHPASNAHCARSPLWNMTAKPRMVPRQGRTSTLQQGMVGSFGRMIASFEYVGPPATEVPG